MSVEDAAPRPATIPARHGRTFAMAAAAGVAVANIYYNQPMLGLIERDLPGEVTGLVPTATQLGYALGLFLLVPLGDIVERRRLIVGQFVILGGALALAATAPTAVLVVAASLVLGLSATVAQQIVPLAAHLASPERRGATVGTILSGILTGILLSRTLAGFVATHGGWREMFWLGVPMALAAAALMATVLPHSRPDSTLRYGQLLYSIAGLWREFPALRLAAGTQGLIFAAFIVFWTILAFRLQGPPYGYGADVAGLFGIIGAVGILAAPLAGRFADRYGSPPVVAAGVALTLGSWVVFGTLTSITGLVIGVILLDFAMQTALVANQHIVFALRAEARARLNTVLMGSMFLGGAVGSAAGTVAWSAGGWPAVVGLGLGLGGLAIALQIFGARASLMRSRSNVQSEGKPDKPFAASRAWVAAKERHVVRVKRTIIGIGLLGLAAAAGALAYAWRPALAPVTPPAPSSFEPALVRRGAELALLGDCRTCHTAPDGRTFAGGLALPTPFGTLYSSNITPDPETGVGRWSEAAFSRAMREGVDREGRHLYPAFPYDHYTLTTDADLEALYAYLMSREPVVATAPPNELPFPLNVRLVLAGWKLLFLREGRLTPDATQDETWNRGRYLVEGLGHCGACHSPRNLAGAEEKSRAFEGGEAEGWHAYALGNASQAPLPWTEAALTQYLAEGYHPQHGVARGPMAPVVENLSAVPREDVAAMARYLASLGAGPGSPGTITDATQAAPGRAPQSTGAQAATPNSSSDDVGAHIYATACASCHESGRPVSFGGIHLSLSTAIAGESPENLVNVILEGLPAQDGVAQPIMPGFAAVLTDQQLADLVAYVRSRFGQKPVWTGVEQAVRDARAARQVAMLPAPK